MPKMRKFSEDKCNRFTSVDSAIDIRDLFEGSDVAAELARFRDAIFLAESGGY